MEFVNLNSENSLINVPQLDYTPLIPTNKDLLMREVCGIEKYYGDASPEDYFRRENLFSELVNDYQRAKARYNLGIGEEFSLVWGNITGSIENQQDLLTYISNKFIEYTNNHNIDINNLLRQWALEINNKLAQKIDKYSPHLEGIPTTTLPSIEDNSARIASTEWVNLKLSTNDDYNLKWIKLNKTYMFEDDDPQTINLTWAFYNTPEEIYINGESVNRLSTEHTFFNVDSSFSIHFSYKVNDKWYNKLITFEKVHAHYYGTENDIHSMTKSKDSLMIVNSLEDKFVYLYIPNDGNARLFVDNILGGFITVGNTVINGVLYYLYRTVNSGLGELYIKYDKQ